MMTVLHIEINIGKCQLTDILRILLAIHIFVYRTAGSCITYDFIRILIVRRMSGSQEERKRIFVFADIESFATGNAITPVDLEMLTGRV